MKELLLKSKRIHEAIVEEGQDPNLDPEKHCFFPDAEDLMFQDIEWKQIEQTHLGRRLNTYFNQLRTDKKMLQYHLKGIKTN